MAFPGTYNFNYYRGDTYEFTISPKNSSGTAFDLTDYTAVFSIAASRGVTPLILSSRNNPQELLADIDGSSITCQIIDIYGATLDATTYVYDVQINKDATETEPSITYTLLTGTITVSQDVDSEA